MKAIVTDVVQTVQQDDPALTLLKAARYARQTVEAGFTTVRDVGFRDHAIFQLKRAIESGLLPGPRIAAAGRVICMTNGHASFIGQEADGPDAVVAAVRAQVNAGAEVIKFIASGGVLTPGTSPDSAQMTPEELAAGMAEARRAGCRVAAHSHSAQGMQNAVRAGAHSIEHATLMDEEAALLMKTHGTAMVPTLSALATTAAPTGRNRAGSTQTRRGHRRAESREWLAGGVDPPPAEDGGQGITVNPFVICYRLCILAIRTAGKLTGAALGWVMVQDIKRTK